MKSEHTSADPKQSSAIVKCTVSYLNIQHAAGARYNIYQIKDKTKDSNRPMQMTDASLKVSQIQVQITL